jgi:anti-sigma28 factor (negative regulator of flagellin synthesis)
MDPFDNPQMFQRSIENPADPADETETCAAQPSGKRSVDADPAPIEDARREKIESLRKAVADGTYSVSANEVARKLIEHMLEPKE